MSDRRVGWVAIGLFVGIPWVLGLVHLVIQPPGPESEIVGKARLLANRGPVDTIVIGDSRVLRLGGEPLSKRGWRYFNMGLTGISPEDSALQVAYVLKHSEVKRLIVGVSFENMTQSAPFQHARHAWEDPFAQLSLGQFGGNPPPKRQQTSTKRVPRLGDLLPVGKGASTVRYYRSLWAGEIGDAFLPDGRAAYPRVQREIKAGTYDFVWHRDPNHYFSRTDSQAGYLKSQALSKAAKALYSGVFKVLRQAGISCVVFETGRTSAYQKLIDDDSLLSRLQREWRSFYRSESRGSIKFLPVASLGGCYAETDFFDAAHCLGGTPARLTERLAAELELLEAAGNK